MEGGEGLGDERPGWGRFHESEDGRLFVFYYVGGRDAEGRSISENRIVEIHADGSHGEPTAIELVVQMNRALDRGMKPILTRRGVYLVINNEIVYIDADEGEIVWKLEPDFPMSSTPFRAG